MAMIVFALVLMFIAVDATQNLAKEKPDPQWERARSIATTVLALLNVAQTIANLLSLFFGKI